MRPTPHVSPEAPPRVRGRLPVRGNRRLRPVLVVLGTLLLVLSARADIAVIVNKANPVQALSNRQVAELYLGRARTFESGQYAVVVDQAGEGDVRRQFFKDISGLSLGQVTAYWMRLKFTGQVQPPHGLDGDAAVLEFVRTTPTAIGFVNSTLSVDPKVKTVLVLPAQAKSNP